jgi:hypothetical protein
MSRRWFAPLEALGRLGLPSILPQALFRRPLAVGDPGAADALGGRGWKDYLDPARLFDVWGPHPDGPWGPYHCVPLFAALDRLVRNEVGPAVPPGSRHRPASPPELPAHARPGAPAPAWWTPSTWTILDLPGARSVEAAVWLVGATGAQPVCTFDNWPHEKGVLKPELALAELLRWATTLEQARPRITPQAPPLWICERERLGERPGRPREFDNRYYLDDSVLPGPGVLRRHGIERVVYVVPDAADQPMADVEGYFGELLLAGIDVFRVGLGAADARVVPFASRRTARPLKRTGYRRSAVGGFGTLVPEPSSGGSG